MYIIVNELTNEQLSKEIFYTREYAEAIVKHTMDYYIKENNPIVVKMLDKNNK